MPIEQAVETMKAALENGCNLWNGAEFYGTAEYNSMTILNAYFTKYPEDAEKVVLTMKGGVNLENIHPNGSPENVRKSLDNIIRQLGGKKKLDLFSCSRRDHSVPLETTFGVIQKEYIDSGKLGGIALSECSADTVRDAVKIAKIHIAEVELSMFSPDILNNDVAQACAENDILIEAYSPMGRGVSIHPTQECMQYAFNVNTNTDHIFYSFSQDGSSSRRTLNRTALSPSFPDTRKKQWDTTSHWSSRSRI